MGLRELYREHDEAWESFIAIPWERRELGSDLQGEALALDTRLRSLSEQIRTHRDKRDFEDDLKGALGEQIRAAPRAVGAYRREYASNKAVAVYRALSNVEWEHETGSRFQCSFRYAGGMIARIRDEGDYIDWYCSGEEGHVDDDIAEALAAKGWKYKEMSWS